jgi:hypothetical protein
MRAGVLLLALIASVPPVLLAVNAIATTVPQFFDPCFEWGTGSGRSRTLVRDDPCAATGRGGTSETKRQAVTRLLLIPGGLLVASALGILGAVLRRPLVAVLGAVVIYAASLPFMLTLASVAAFTSGAFLLVARFTSPLSGAPKVIVRALGAVAAMFALSWIQAAIRPTVNREALLFLFAVVGFHLFVAVAAWWPYSRPVTPS